MDRGYTVIYYHLVSDLPTPYYNGKKVSTRMFREHIKYFKKNKSFVSFSDISELRSMEKDLSKFIVLTFDDGYRLNVEAVGNILADEKIPATFFLTGTTLMKKLMWRDYLTFGLHFIAQHKPDHVTRFCKEIKHSFSWQSEDYLRNTEELCVNFSVPMAKEIEKQYSPYLSTDTVKSLMSSGHKLGLHSQNHPYFPNLKLSDAVKEVVSNNDLVSELFGTSPNAFSFPFGARYPMMSFYRMVMEQTNVRYFCGIQANVFSNRSTDDPVWTERLGMEDHRPLFISSKIRPIFRSVKTLWS